MVQILFPVKYGNILRDGKHTSLTDRLLLATEGIVLAQFNDRCLKQAKLIINEWEADGILLSALVIVTELALVAEVEQRADDILLLVVFKAEQLLRFLILFKQTTLDDLVCIGTGQEDTCGETSLNTREVV